MNFNASLMIERDLDELGPAADQLRVWLAGVMDDDDASGVELALVEALSNSIRHGPSESADPICLSLDVLDGQVAIEIADGSPAMPTLFDGAGERKLELSLDDIDRLPEGGRGLSLIVLSMDEVGFVHKDGQSRLCMVRYRK